jgi:hypothetical protein
MRKKFYFSTIFLLLFSYSAFSQQNLAGKILKKGSPEVIQGVNIRNGSTNKYSRSDMGGNYRILVVPGDTLFFTSAGYKADTIIVSLAMLSNEYDIYLVPNLVGLATVEIDALSKYEADSVQRRQDYAYILDRKHPVKLMNEKRKADAPGFNFSPIGYYSKHEKEKRKLIKQLKEEDENQYIDARFPRSRVGQVTKLSGDSLQQFMLRYRPSYVFCRSATNQDILLYINDKVILFRKGANKNK